MFHGHLYTSFAERSIHILYLLFKTGWFVLWLLSCKSCYIYRRLQIYRIQIYALQIFFFCSVDCLFTLFMMSYGTHYNFNKVNLLLFFCYTPGIIPYVFIMGVQSLSHVWLFVTPACQAPLSTWFPSQEYWSGLPFPFQGNFPSQQANPCLLADRFFTTRANWDAPVSLS